MSFIPDATSRILGALWKTVFCGEVWLMLFKKIHFLKLSYLSSIMSLVVTNATYEVAYERRAARCFIEFASEIMFRRHS